MILKINGEFTELFYCFRHKRWNFIDDEMNCCQQEKEDVLHD